MRKVLEGIAKRLTWANVRWFVGVNLFGWIMQGVIYGLLVLAGVGALESVVSAKVANWVVFVGQCVRKARA